MMTTGDGFSVISGFTEILCTPEKPLASDRKDFERKGAKKIIKTQGCLVDT